jgi:CRP-like cAMP-binding protein
MSNGALSLDRFFSKSGQGRAIQHIPRSSRLFAQGKQGQSVFYVMAGVVGLTVALNGKERIVSLLGSGSFAGKECIAADQPRSASTGTWQ